MSIDESKRDLGYLLSDANRELRAALADNLRKHGLDDSSYVILYHTLRSVEGGATTQGLADTLRMPLSALDEWVDRLARVGWLTTAPDPSAKGSRLVLLTDKSKAAVPVLADAAYWAIESGLNGFSDDEVTQFISFLERMKSNLA